MASKSARQNDFSRRIDKAVSEPWDFRDADTKAYSHNIHRYSGKFIPQIAAKAIAAITNPDEVVLDPYCGSGTCVLEALLLQRRAIGIDLNPLATLIAECKVTPIPSKLLDDFLIRVRSLQPSNGPSIQAHLFQQSPSIESYYECSSNDRRLNDPWYRKWFQEDVLRDLIALDHAISDLADTRIQRLGRIALSNILRKSSNAHSGYPNVMFDKNAPKKRLPGPDFVRSAERIVEQVRRLPSDIDWSAADVVLGDASSLPLADASVDAIVTHPPYIGSIPYAEYCALSLTWLGHSPKQLDRVLTGGRRQTRDVVDRFRNSYQKMLLESKRVLRPRRHLFVLVGNPVVRGEVVDLADMTRQLAAITGLELVAETTRNGINRRANKMGHETLLFLEKRTL